jgi:hypothetical protein
MLTHAPLLFNSPAAAPARPSVTHLGRAVRPEARHLALAAVDDPVHGLWRGQAVFLRRVMWVYDVRCWRVRSRRGCARSADLVNRLVRQGGCQRDALDAACQPKKRQLSMRCVMLQRTCRSSVDREAPACSTLPPFMWHPAHFRANVSTAPAHAAGAHAAQPTATAAAAPRMRAAACWLLLAASGRRGAAAAVPLGGVERRSAGSASGRSAARAAAFGAAEPVEACWR